MNPNVTAASDYVPNTEITISPDNQSHDQTLSPAASSHYCSPPNWDSYDLYWHARANDWNSAQPIVENNPDVVSISLTERGDTVLHVAADADSTTFVEELVKLLVNRPQDLLIPNSEGMLPVHLAVLTANKEMVLCLCPEPVLHLMAYEDIEKLFFMSICNNMFGTAAQIFNKNRRGLAIARYQEAEESLTALHMLARKPSEILNMKSKDHNGKGIPVDLALFRNIWCEIKSLPNKEIFELISQPSAILFDAIKSGHRSAVEELLGLDLQLFIKDPNGQNLVHYLVQYRHFNYFSFIDFKREQIIRAVDIEGNNVLHMAAHLPLQFQAFSFSGLRASIQMRKELAWFKKVAKKVPSELRSMRNKEGKRPIDVFYDEHKKLSDEIKESAKGIANSGMVVATLVATVAFAAALTVPGDKKSKWFVVFIITNAIALFSSSASILSFLSNFTSSRFAESEFVISLHPSLTFGRALLIISVAAMVVAFVATSFLIFEDRRKWVSYVVAAMGIFSLLLFPLFQFSFIDDLIWSRWYRPKWLLSPPHCMTCL